MACIEQSRARHSPEMECAFVTDDVEKLMKQSRKLQTVDQLHWWAARKFLTFFNTIRFCRYLALPNKRTELKSKIEIKQLLGSLKRDHLGNALGDTTGHILNLSNYNLSD